jgi:hypothetical protein
MKNYTVENSILSSGSVKRCGSFCKEMRFFLQRDADHSILSALPEYDVLNYAPPGNVYGILAAPPRAEFSRAKNAQPRNFTGALKTVNACLQIIQRCRLPNPLKFWALENPVGYLRQFLGRTPFIF